MNNVTAIKIHKFNFKLEEYNNRPSGHGLCCKITLLCYLAVYVKLICIHLVLLVGTRWNFTDVNQNFKLTFKVIKKGWSYSGLDSYIRVFLLINRHTRHPVHMEITQSWKYFRYIYIYFRVSSKVKERITEVCLICDPSLSDLEITCQVCLSVLSEKLRVIFSFLFQLKYVNNFFSDTCMCFKSLNRLKHLLSW